MRAGIFILVVLIAVGCDKKKYPETVKENEPEFFVSAMVDNSPLALTAGENGYYMYSSYTLDENNVYCFKADIKKADCDNCLRMQVAIRDRKISSFGQPAAIDSAIVTVNDYKMQSGPSYQVQFNSSYNKTAATYLWDFGDGTTSSQSNPLHVYNRNGKYNVSLSITSNNSCLSSISSVQKIGQPVTSCRAAITANAAGADSASFSASVQGTGPFTYLWNFGDGQTSTASSTFHKYNVSGSYPVTLMVVAANQDTAFAKYNFVTQSDQSSCVTNYSVGAITIIEKPLSLSEIVITFTDASGIIYSSNSGSQPASSYLKVLSVEDYMNNENNQRTKKIRVRFKCHVYNGNAFKVIDNAEATICVAYQ